MAYPMIDVVTGCWILVDGRLADVNEPAAASFFLPTDERMFYEVVRIDRGIPLFWEEHLARLATSVDGQLAIPDNLYADCRRLIAANALNEANLRIVLSPSQCVVHLAPSYYPADETKRTGVPTGILKWERVNPNTKVIRSDYKEAVAAGFARTGPVGPFFELLLADRQGHLTEGSRSNVFFIRDNQVISAPDSLILKGITRNHVRQAIAAAGLDYAEDLLTLADIRRGACAAAFLTGSPIDVLPIRAIEEVLLPSAEHPGLLRIMAAYAAIVERYIAERQKDDARRQGESAAGTAADVAED